MGLNKARLSPILNQWTDEPYARDSGHSTYAYVPNCSGTKYITYDLGSAKSFMIVLMGYTRIDIGNFDHGPGYAYLHIEISNDDVSYQILDSSLDLYGAQWSQLHESKSDTITKIATARYIRIYGYAACWGATTSAEVRVYDTMVITD